MAISQNYAAYVTAGAGILATGDTSRTSPSSLVTIFTPYNGTTNNGGQVERISLIPVGNTTASAVRIFRYDGTTNHLYTEIAVSTLTAVGSTANTTLTIEAADNPNLFPILIPIGWTLRATINDAQPAGFKITAEGGSY